MQKIFTGCFPRYLSEHQTASKIPCFVLHMNTRSAARNCYILMFTWYVGESKNKTHRHNRYSDWARYEFLHGMIGLGA